MGKWGRRVARKAMRGWIAGSLVAVLAVLGLSSESRADEALWAELRAGTSFAMIRHALAPGTGDPEGFVLDDCSSQRNLSAEGRKQAREIGKRFRDSGIAQAEVYTSAWCRCRDTAQLLGLGPVETMASLNSFYATPDRREAQNTALRAWLVERMSMPASERQLTLVLVTHFVNISALAGLGVGSGDIAVLRLAADGEVELRGVIVAPAVLGLPNLAISRSIS